jgi:hypothetical protein
MLILTLAIIMILPQTVYAGWGNGNGNSNGIGNDKVTKSMPYGQLKKLEKFTEMDTNKIRVGNKHINFDVPPVLKGNRTLIPVRAITEALGCDVKWEAPKAYIISPNEDKIIVFDLESGKVYIAADSDEKDWTYEELMTADDQTWIDLEVTIDSAPGLVNNRTFVPLRFIAEELGLKVGYNQDTGMIDIDQAPEIAPKKVVVNDATLLPTTFEIKVSLNDFEFKGIEGLTEDVDYTIDADDAIVLTESYLKDITEYKTKLVLLFKKDTVEVEESFVIKLNYLTDTPVLTPDEITFNENETSGLSYEFDMELNGFELTQVTSSSALLIDDTHYKIDDDKVTIKEAFLKTLNVGVTKLSFLFVRNSEVKTLDVTINVEEVHPIIAPSSMYVESDEDLTLPKDIDIDLNGYTLKEVKDLVEDIDYTLDDDLTLTLLSTYLEDLDEAKTVISLVFEKENKDDVTLDFTIEQEYLYLKPVLSPEDITFSKDETDELQVLIDMKLYGFELSAVIDNNNQILIKDTDYEVDELNSELVLKEDFLSTLEVGTETIVLRFVRDNKEVSINYEIKITE